MEKQELKFERSRHKVRSCPCGKSNADGKFAPFAGYEDKGYCHSCGKSFFPQLNRWQETSVSRFHSLSVRKQETVKPLDFLTAEEFLQYLEAHGNHNEHNSFLRWLVRPERGACALPLSVVHQLIRDYCITNSKDFPKATLFPYIDIRNRVRDIKLMEYNEFTGKRIREGGKCFYIINRFLKKTEPNTSRCFFGEFLLIGNQKPVKIFESEATAVYCAPFFPDSVCLATGGKNGCKWTNEDVCSVLKGRKVTLYPDLDAYPEWEEAARTLRKQGLAVSVSALLKDSAVKYSKATGIKYEEMVKQKFDLRDILKHKNYPA